MPSANKTSPSPVRLRRLLDVALLESAYGRGVHDRVPVEIVDLDDGTILCEWACERDDEVVGRRVLYASEADMWRELHTIAQTQGVMRTIPFYAARAWSSASASMAPPAPEAVLERAARADATSDFHADTSTPGLDVADDSARAAWVDRDVGLLAILVDDDALVLPSRLPRWVPVPGESDGRALDSLGRRNGHGGRRPDVSRTLRA